MLDSFPFSHERTWINLVPALNYGSMDFQFERWIRFLWLFLRQNRWSEQKLSLVTMNAKKSSFCFGLFCGLSSIWSQTVSSVWPRPKGVHNGRQQYWFFWNTSEKWFFLEYFNVVSAQRTLHDRAVPLWASMLGTGVQRSLALAPMFVIWHKFPSSLF